MRNFSEEFVGKNQNTYFILKNSLNLAVYKAEKLRRVGQATDNNVVHEEYLLDN